MRLLAQLQSLAAVSTVGVAVQIDRSASFALQKDQGAWTGTRRLLSGKDGLMPVAELGQVNSAAAQTLRSFLRWGQAALPAEHTILFLWSHGFGEQAVLRDESAGSQLGLAELALVLHEFPVDLLALDACSMQSLAVARMLAEPPAVAPWLVASESLQDSDAWPYRGLIEHFEHNPRTSPTEAVHWLATHAETRTGPFTLSIVRLSEAARLGLATDQVVAGIRALDNGRRGQVRARIRALRSLTRELDTVDLGAVLYSIRPLLPQLVTDTLAAYAAAITYSIHGRDFDDATGMAIPRSLFLAATNGL